MPRPLPIWTEQPGVRWRWAKRGKVRRLEVCIGITARTFVECSTVRPTPRRVQEWARLLAATEATAPGLGEMERWALSQRPGEAVTQRDVMRG